MKFNNTQRHTVSPQTFKEVFKVFFPAEINLMTLRTGFNVYVIILVSRKEKKTPQFK